MRDFIYADRNQMTFLPPSIDEWLPQNHLARFVVDVVDGLDLGAFEREYGVCGKAAYAPQLLVSLLFYGYSTGVFSSRKIEMATHDSVAFRFIAADLHPDHDTIAYFRRRFLPQLEELFVQIVLMARELGFAKVGRVSIDGTKIKANASKHKAMSWVWAQRIEKQLRKEIACLLAKAEEADNASVDDGLDIPLEIALRRKRLERIAEAKKAMKARAKQRYEHERREYEAKLARREQKARQGNKPGGREPKPPSSAPRDKDQYNFTDNESRIMKHQGHFEQAYNAQIAVDTDSMIIVGNDCTNHSNDKNELLSVIEKIPHDAGNVKEVIADCGYYNESEIRKCENEKQIDVYVAVERQDHHPPLQQRLNASEPTGVHANGTFREYMTNRLRSPEGRAIYALRKQTAEPVFGITKSVIGFRQFLLRGQQATAGEWSLVCSAFNIKRMHAMISLC